MPDEPVADGAASAPVPTSGSASSGESVPVSIPTGVDPPSPAVDLHVKLGPLQDQSVRRLRAGQIWAWALTGGGLAGFAAWLAGETVLYWFSFEVRNVVTAGEQAVPSAALKNTALAIGLLGWLMALLLGLAGGMVRGSLRSGVRAAVPASGLGLAAGVLATMLVLPPFTEAMVRPDAAEHGRFYAVMALGVVWGSVGAAGGLAFGLGLGGVKRAALGLVGGYLGGMIGAALYIFIGSMGFPTDNPILPVADNRESRLLARALAALCTSAGVAAFIAPTRFQKPQGPVD